MAILRFVEAAPAASHPVQFIAALRTVLGQPDVAGCIRREPLRVAVPEAENLAAVIREVDEDRLAIGRIRILRQQRTRIETVEAVITDADEQPIALD